MAISLPLLRQPVDTFWCLPTAVLSVLLYYGIEDVSVAQVARWCSARDRGCSVDDAIHCLRGDEIPLDLEVEDLSSADDAEIQARVNDDVAPEPAIVVIAPEPPGFSWRPTGDPILPPDPDHAVVVTGITETQVMYMDPLTGAIEQIDPVTFRRMHRRAGHRAFVIRA